MSIRIQKRFQVPVWNEEIRQNAITFWAQRRIKFDETSSYRLVGRRGNLFGNLISFDMSKLITKLTVTVSNENEIDCTLDINTLFQQITTANKIWWDLEMQAFESSLLRNDEQNEVWESFITYHKKAAWKWVLFIVLSTLASAIISIIFSK